MPRITQSTLNQLASDLIESRFSQAARLFSVPLPAYDPINVNILETTEAIEEALSNVMSKLRMMGVRKLRIELVEYKDDPDGRYHLMTMWHHPGIFLAKAPASSPVILFCQDGEGALDQIRMVDVQHPSVPLTRLLTDPSPRMRA